MGKTVFVGLSGGVDSAVSAALLKEEGHLVVGAFIKIWSPEFIECTWKDDRLDAMRVCAALQIPFLEVDLSRQYKDEVVADMLSNYQRGLTPNPDVLCNRSIKFGHFARWAFGNGAERIATGHYARTASQGGTLKLLRGKDVNKDQSYFLYPLDQSDLARTFFPVGEYTKPEIRALAKKYRLPNAQKPDSQGLCFVGDVSMKDFLARFIPLEKGDVVDESGAKIGTHDGAALYTLGERHGFSANGSGIHYVVHVDIARNLVQVSPRREDAARRHVRLSHMHWIGQASELPVRAQAQARYRETPFWANVSMKDGSNVADISFDEPHIAAPGQSLVFYDGEKCLGGGMIG
jgi:tRNA-specific 2-thiouridylase